MDGEIVTGCRDEDIWATSILTVPLIIMCRTFPFAVYEADYGNCEGPGPGSGTLLHRIPSWISLAFLPFYIPMLIPIGITVFALPAAILASEFIKVSDYRKNTKDVIVCPHCGMPLFGAESPLAHNDDKKDRELNECQTPHPK
jgi:hypothetical protein